MIRYNKLPNKIKKHLRPPKYIQLSNGTCLRLMPPPNNAFADIGDWEYFRDAGCWSVGILKATYGDESWYVLDCSMYDLDSPLYEFNFNGLYPCSKKQWQESNNVYI